MSACMLALWCAVAGSVYHGLECGLIRDHRFCPDRVNDSALNGNLFKMLVGILYDSATSRKRTVVASKIPWLNAS